MTTMEKPKPCVPQRSRRQREDGQAAEGGARDGPDRLMRARSVAVNKAEIAFFIETGALTGVRTSDSRPGSRRSRARGAPLTVTSGSRRRAVARQVSDDRIQS